MSESNGYTADLSGSVVPVDSSSIPPAVDLSGEVPVDSSSVAPVDLSGNVSISANDLSAISTIAGSYLNDTANIHVPSNMSTLGMPDIDNLSTVVNTVETLAEPVTIPSIAPFPEIYISYLAEIPIYNISNLTCVDLSGNTTNLTTSTIQGIDLLTISSFTARNTIGNTTIYLPSISTLQERSTLNAIQSHFDTSNTRNLSTSMGVLELPMTPGEKISTLIGLSTTNFVLTLDDVLDVSKGYAVIENNNKYLFQNLDYALLKTNLFIWATQGFPDSHSVYQLPVSLPPGETGQIRCSDGALRNIWDYIAFCLGSTLQELMDYYHKNLNGITLTYSLQANPYIVVLHVSRNRQ